MVSPEVDHIKFWNLGSGYIGQTDICSIAIFIVVESSNEIWCSEVLMHLGQHLTFFLP